VAVLPAVGLFRSETLVDVLARIDEENVPYAGATEMVPAMKIGVRRPETLVDLKRLAELRGITVDGAARVVRIGAATTHREVASDAEIRQHLPTLAEAAAHVGNARVRNSGTVGGNLCFAEPRSDLSVVLTALNASARITSASGDRTVSISDFILGAFDTTLEPEEILVAVSVPFEVDGTGYWKLQSYERPTVGIATVPTEHGWRIVIGAATERPEEATIANGDLAAVEAFLDSLDLSDDLSGSPAYKRSVIGRRLTRLIGASAS
jgi:carbon-monoxide dehydrogenase medium subunit